MNGTTLHLDGAQLSDLFFNYEHPVRDALYKKYENQKQPPSTKELREATFEEAKDFVNLYRIINVEPRELVEDFVRRV